MDGLVLTKYITDLLVYQTHIALRELRMSYLIKRSLIIPQGLESRLAKTFFGIWQHDWADSDWECVAEGQLMCPETVEQKLIIPV